MKSETEQSSATTNTATITMTKPTTNKDRNDAITERLNSLGLSSEDSIDESLLDDSAKVVTFSDVQIREYPIIAGGGPTLPSSGGPPITIDWEYQYEEHVSVDMYEFCHPNTNRRHAKQLLLTPYHRARMLFQNGVSMNEIADVTIESDMIKQQRFETYNKLQQGNKTVWKLAIESAGRTVQKLGVKSGQQWDKGKPDQSHRYIQ